MQVTVSRPVAKLLATRAAQVRALTNEAIPSPCVSICRMDAANAFCTGCLRTLDEIAMWGSSDEAAKRAIWTRIEQRLPPLHTPP